MFFMPHKHVALLAWLLCVYRAAMWAAFAGLELFSYLTFVPLPHRCQYLSLSVYVW